MELSTKIGIGLLVIFILLIIGGVAYYFMSGSGTATQAVTTPTPATPTQDVKGNNGTASCSLYCGGIGGKPWNNELPVAWNGAKCVSTSDNRISCDTLPTSIDPNIKSIGCTCAPTGTGWNK